MNMSSVLRLLAVVILAGTGLGQQPQPKPEPPEKPKEEFSDSAFLEKLNRINLFEVALGELTRTQTTNPDVMAYGEKMITEHQRLDAELAALAAKKQIKLPGKLTETELKQVEQFKKLSGRDFDRKYVDEMVSGHATAVDLVKKASAGARDSEVRSLAVDSLPHLEHHLKEAKELKAKVVPEKDERPKPGKPPETPKPEKPDKP